MVDVTGKPWTHRRALARCHVEMGGAAHALSDELINQARLAGIQAAKQTARLIPLCHPLAVSDVDVSVSVRPTSIEIEGTAEVIGQTGVEMEALTACAFAALTLTAALSPTDEGVRITDLELWEKSGGRSGTWLRQRHEDRTPREEEGQELDRSRRSSAATTLPSA